MPNPDDAVFPSAPSEPFVGEGPVGGGGAIIDIVFGMVQTAFIVTCAAYAGGEVRAVSYDGPNVITNCPSGGAVFPIIGGHHIIQAEGDGT